MTAATFDDALALASAKFKGVLDKGNQPYIQHCLRVMSSQNDDTSRQVALLHDIVEDTDVSLEQLRRDGYRDEVISAVDALTHRPEESYQQYVLRLAENEVALRVKLADLQDNYRIDRVAYRPEHRQEDIRRVQRYILTHQFLTNQIDREQYLDRMLIVAD